MSYPHGLGLSCNDHRMSYAIFKMPTHPGYTVNKYHRDAVPLIVCTMHEICRANRSVYAINRTMVLAYNWFLHLVIAVWSRTLPRVKRVMCHTFRCRIYNGC